MSKRIFFGILALTIFIFSAHICTLVEASSGHEKQEHGEEHQEHVHAEDHEHAETAGGEHGHDKSDEHGRHDEAAHGEAHGDAHGGGHHFWWTFTGYEFPFALIACLYYAMVLRFWPKWFGKHEEDHH